jgi:hypothetical protein
VCVCACLTLLTRRPPPSSFYLGMKVDATNAQGWTPLYTAAWVGNLELIRFFVKQVSVHPCVCACVRVMNDVVFAHRAPTSTLRIKRAGHHSYVMV